ncbi:hypothetical protein L7F22_052731 [Adiantum nelumboides]|nr:hypothetical protein [Adiantum nelumboides]
MTRMDTRDSIDYQATENDPLLVAEAGFVRTNSRNGKERATDEGHHYRHSTFNSPAAADLPKKCSEESIFPLLQKVRDDIRATIDTHLDWNELTAIDVNYAVVRPLALKYSEINNDKLSGQDETGNVNLSILFVFLVNRVQFQRDAERDLALQNVNNTRANLCELLAMKLLRTFARDGLQLITALTFPFSTFQGAEEEILSSEGLLNKDTGEPLFGPAQSSSALELAILSRAKKFIKTPLCQRCISGIYEGRVVISYQSAHAIIDDSYKKRPLGLYNPATAPFLDHHRLRVPLIRSRIEFCNFGILLLLYVWCLSKKSSTNWTLAETMFTIWLGGFALDEVTQMQEHGLTMYLSSLYNLLDLMFCLISFIWFVIRLNALSQGDLGLSSLSFETLSLGAILLCPRVASVLIQDNVILLALKAMLSDFVFFMLLAAVCFSGFLYTFWAISGPEWTPGKILWIMIKVWFGNSYVGFDTAQSLSPIFGPALMVFFAVMANTLLLTILISLLSNTFSIVAQNAVEEAMYQFACKTVSGISSEALISYAPPLNLLALIVMVPASFFLTPRYLHKANVYLLRATSWPILLLIRLSTHWPSGLKKYSATSYVIGSANAERAGHLISWLPLPRSRSNPDRDMIQAAFMHSTRSSESRDETRKAGKNATNTSKFKTTDHDGSHESSSRDVPHDEWSASMLRIRPGEEDAHSISNSADQPASTSKILKNREQGPNTPIKSQKQRSYSRIGESPLARLFGRALRNSAMPTPPATNDTKEEENVKSSTDQSVDSQQLIDFDCANADQVKANAEINERKIQADDLIGYEEEEGEENGKSDDLIHEQTAVRGLVNSLSKRLDEQEERQKRIEELLQLILKNQERQTTNET